MPRVPSGVAICWKPYSGSARFSQTSVTCPPACTLTNTADSGARSSLRRVDGQEGDLLAGVRQVFDDREPELAGGVDPAAFLDFAVAQRACRRQ